VAPFHEAVHSFVDLLEVGLLKLPLYHDADLCTEFCVLIAGFESPIGVSSYVSGYGECMSTDGWRSRFMTSRQWVLDLGLGTRLRSERLRGRYPDPCGG